MQMKIAIVIHDGKNLQYFTSLARLSNDPNEAMLFTNGTKAVSWAIENDLSLDDEWTLAQVSISGQIQVSLINSL